MEKNANVNGAPPWPPKTRRKVSLKSNWQLYLLVMRGILAWLEKQFERLGKSVTTYPKVTILISLVGVSICAVGFVRLRFESRSSKLFVPQNSPSFKALDIGSPYFQNLMNVRNEEVVLIPRSADKNVIRKSCLEDAIRVMNNIKGIPDFRQLCKRRPDFVSPNEMVQFDHCRKVNILEVLGDVSNSTIESIQQRMMTALANVSLLMSNGKNLLTNRDDIFADFQVNSAANNSVSAKALRIVIHMQQIQNTTHEERIMKWEKSFISNMKALKSQLMNTDLYFTAERSMDDAISDSSSADVSLISITFAVMITFACLVLSKFSNPIRGHNWLAMSGVISTALGILAGIGAAVAFGVPFISLVGVVPFLVVSIGIDDMFILVDEYDRQSDGMSSRDRVKFTLSKVGSTITMTTLTDVVAFYISTTTSFPAIRYFCIYVALCISLEFILQITLFVAFMTFDSIRIYQRRCDLFPFLRVRDRNSCNIKSTVSITDRVMHIYGTYLLKWPVKLCVLVLSLSMVGFGIYGCLHIENELTRSSLALPGSYFLDYINTFEKNYPQTIPVSIQVTSPVDYSSPAVRKEIAKSVNVAYNTGYYLSRNISWIANFEEFVTRFNVPSNGANFTTALSTFLSIPEFRQHKLNVITDSFNNIVASRLIVFYKDNSKSEFHKDAMVTLRNDLKSKLGVDVTIASSFFIYFEQYAVVVNEVTWNLVAVTAVVIIIMFPFCIHPLIVLILTVCFVSLIIELFGLMYLWHVQLNSLAMINLVMAIGFAVDYSSHVAHAFVISREDTPNQRIIHALGSVGSSVLLGGASTFLGMSLTAFAKSTIFKIFFKMIVGIIVFGLYNGLVLLPVLLSISSHWLDTSVNKKNVLRFQQNREKVKYKGKRKTKFCESKNSVSILGMSTRFPLVRNKNQLWELLESSINTVSEYPENRGTRYRLFKNTFNPSKGVPGKHYVLHGSFLEEIDGFDYRFFGISEAEATSMDPQQRLLLQGTYEAIEDAGMTIEELQQCRTGVYTGIMNLDFVSVTMKGTGPKVLDQFSSTGASVPITANRISFAFNLSGPSIAFDTACSSSLTALVAACDHLEKGIIDVAIVGTANIVLDEVKHASICKANMLSPDGKCKSFDESADGYGRGEGVVVFILKSTNCVVNRYESYGEIISWGVNNDGQTAAPITAPSIIKQKALMSEVLQESGIDPSDVQYIEMHGTGTYIGDLVETGSVGEVYGSSRDTSDPVLIGSIKSNLSHTESTAGSAGLAKVCLMLEHQRFVPTVGIKEQAVRLDLEDKRLRVCTESSPWPSKEDGIPRIAAVNSFGFGGSNGHILIRETEANPREEDGWLERDSSPKMLTLSTKSATTLIKMAEIFSTWLKSVDDNAENKINICYTMSERRTKYNHRLVVNVNSLREASNLLKDFADNPDLSSGNICSGKASKFSSKVGFVFGGQGSQWLGMAGDLLSNDDISSTLKHVDQAVKEAGIQASVLAYLSDEFVWSDSLSEDLVACQLSIFALQYSVARFMIDKAGIQPVAVTGHSLGDITAACVADIISLSQAVKLIGIRAKVQDKCQKSGAMAAVGLSTDEANGIIEELGLTQKLCIAAENDKNNVTISGDEDAIAVVEKHFKEQLETKFFRKLSTKKAFHSHHMDPIKEKFMKKLHKANVVPRNGNVKFFSTTEGNLINGVGLDDCFWWRNLRNPVLFNTSITKMMKSGIRTFVEISPRPVVSHYVREIVKQTSTKDVFIIQALPKKSETERMRYLRIQCIGKMFTIGYSINFELLQDYSSAQLMRYPSYPWDEHHLWPKDDYLEQENTMLLLGPPVSLNEDHCIWENEIDLHRFSFLKDHRQKAIGIIFPGAAFIELAFEAAIMGNKIQPLVMSNVQFKSILPLTEDVLRKIRCTKRSSNDGSGDKFEVVHVTDQGEVILSTADILTVDKNLSDTTYSFSEALKCQEMEINSKEYSTKDSIQSAELFNGTSLKIEAEKLGNGDHASETKVGSCGNEDVMLETAGLSHQDKIDLTKLDEFTKSMGFLFGERFSMMDASWATTNVALTKLRLSDDFKAESSCYILHPCIIDACLQTKLCLELQRSIISGSPPSALPVGIGTLFLYPIKRKFQHVYCFASSTSKDESNCEFLMMDEKANVFMKIDGLMTEEIASKRRRPTMEESIYKFCWSSSTNTINSENKVNNASFVIVSGEDTSLSSTVVSALHKLGVNDDNINSVSCQETNDGLNIEEKLTSLFKSVSCHDKRLVIMNLLPLSTQRLPLEASFSKEAESLCFESTLEILKVLSNLDINESNVISISGDASEDKWSPASSRMSPWGGISRGMAVSADLEVKQRVISVELRCNADETAFTKVIIAATEKTAENRIVITDTQLLQPVIRRYDSKIKEEESKDNTDLLQRKQNDFYLSWSQSRQSFELKRLSNESSSLQPGFVEIKVSHVSSAFGKTEKILDGVRQFEPNKNCQCLVGNITMINEGDIEFEIGDEVVAFLATEWVRSRIRVPMQQVFKKPVFLSKEQAAVVSGPFTVACMQLEHFEKSDNNRVAKMYVAASHYDRGICWMIAMIAEAKGISVIMKDYSNPQMLLQETENDSSCIDYLVCSSELHPGDAQNLLGKLHNDSIVIFINFAGKRHNWRLDRAAKVFNMPPLNAMRPEYLKGFFNKELLILRSIMDVKEMPTIRTENVDKVVDADGQMLHNNKEATFDCVKLEAEDEVPIYLKPASLDYQGLKEDRTYIVAGGSRGIGLKTVEWMASRGAKTIVAIGVSPISPSTQMTFDELKRKFNTNINHIRVNIANEDEIRILDESLDKLPPVAGVINSAGILDDKEFYKIDRSSYRRVMGPKVNGTLNLQILMEKRKQELDFFVLYSSSTPIFGNRGQTSYSAANDFLNSFAKYQRYVCGKPCLSVCWGPMGGAGMLDRSASAALVLESAGFYMLDIDQGIKWMEEIMLSNPDETCICICDIDWQRFLKLSPAYSSLCDIMRREIADISTSHSEDILTMLSNASLKEEQEYILLEFIKKILATFTGGSEEEIDCHISLISYGVDSVGASLFKSQILLQLNIDIEVFFFVLPETTPVSLTNVLLEKLHESKDIIPVPHQDMVEQEEENGFLHNRSASGRHFYSFHTVAPQYTDEYRIRLPDTYLTAIYDPPDAIAKMFIVHPSHRYAGVFQAVASGFKYQELFSLYAFGYQDPTFIGDDYKSIRVLAEACTELLLRQEPNGPYFLAGYSFGGVVAVEIATILENIGKTVAFVTMIDSSKWIPESAYNSKTLSFTFTQPLERGITEQVKGFFERTALTRLKITKGEYDDDTKRLSLQEIADYLTDRANNLNQEIPDSSLFLQSLVDDYKIALKCASEWYPPENMYKGPVAFIRAETCLCQKVDGYLTTRKCMCSIFIGSSFERWSYLLPGDTFLVTCDGDHFSMIEKSRGQHIGNILATSASLVFRKISGMAGGIVLSQNHAIAKDICRSRGITAYMIRKSALRTSVVDGSIIFSETDRKIVFQGKGLLASKMQIKIGDVVGIRKVDAAALQKLFKSADFSHHVLHSGYIIQLLKQKVAFMCSNKRDFNNFRYLLEAIYSIKLPV